MADALLALVHREARLLDSWQLDDWLALFHPDGRYWLPIEEGSDPRTTSSVIYDDVHGLAIRVEQLMRQNRISQQPRSETIHFITNVEAQDGGDRATVHYNLLLTELRSGDWRQQGLGQIRQHPGRVKLELRRVDGEWKILEKCLVLLERSQPIEGLSYLL